MKFLRVRKIGIDVLPVGEPFILVCIEKVTVDENDNETQVIGNFDRMYLKLHEVMSIQIHNISNDGVIDYRELYNIIAATVYTWVIQKHGGSMKGERLVIEP
ncbi:hypothetical protein GD1_106 [Paraglaciecola Antarctic GD virus 1]|nr:hypothetical protein GD1_106 [Paraglaciecola Antarctic GD virus 1]